MCQNIIELHKKKIEKQITQILDNTNELKEIKMKGESHLQELSDAVDFITKKFDKYEQERKEREEIINNLTENVSRLTQNVDDLLEAVEKQEQYSTDSKAQLLATAWTSWKETRKYWRVVYQSDKWTFRLQGIQEMLMKNQDL